MTFDLAVSVLDACDYLEARHIHSPIKRRDPIEPGRREKELAEIELTRAMLALFRAQRKAVQALLEQHYPGRKQLPTPPDPTIIMALEEDMGGFWRKVFNIVQSGMIGGVLIFEAKVPIGLDYSLVNMNAVEAARKYVYDQLKPGVDDVTREALRKAISGFVETPGMTIGDVISALPFDEARAERVAVTEITRAYAEGNRLAGEKLKEDFPDVPVIKQWFTNNDDRVCEICGPLHEQIVLLDEIFHTDFGDFAEPPAHPRCRCWTSVTTDISRAT